MKKVLITMAVLTSMVAGSMVFSSFATPKQDVKMECVYFSVGVPIYWEGLAYNSAGHDAIYIRVYQVEGQCNSYYATVKDGDIEVELWVKENPNYNPDRAYYNGKQKYFVTYHNENKYFNM